MNDTFTPQYLRELRIEQRSKLDIEIVQNVKKIILEANSRNKQHVEIYFFLTDPWERVIEHFRELGFVVCAYGSDVKNEYDPFGNQIYRFHFSWWK